MRDIIRLLLILPLTRQLYLVNLINLTSIQEFGPSLQTAKLLIQLIIKVHS